MSLMLINAALLSVVLITAPLHAAPVPGRLIGTVQIKDSAKLDAATTRQLASIAAKIRKSGHKGAIKLKGDMPSAANEAEYLLKSAIMARSVETQLKRMLSGRQQIFIAAPKYSGENQSGVSTVEITLYPYELKVETEGFTSTQVLPEGRPEDGATVQEQPVQPVYQQSTQSGLLTPPPDDDAPPEVTSKKERVIKETENPALANELVLKAKARAAAKAKRLEQGN